jgi:hypothetical protein
MECFQQRLSKYLSYKNNLSDYVDHHMSLRTIEHNNLQVSWAIQIRNNLQVIHAIKTTWTCKVSSIRIIHVLQIKLLHKANTNNNLFLHTTETWMGIICKSIVTYAVNINLNNHCQIIYKSSCTKFSINIRKSNNWWLLHTTIFSSWLSLGEETALCV